LDPAAFIEVPFDNDELLTLGDGGADPPLTGDVTVTAELAGHPRFSSTASCAVAWLSAVASTATVLRAAASVDAFVGVAVASAFLSAVLALAT
jgi:hypothetical protein